ncbi:FAD-dependent oxidoreductase [Psychrobacter sp. N25K4-3-2]|uniref:flavin monoamine oxidase family protein n=1 Tax=Psychrobacter sp. N25K4-3-2 TaxID=2785026 RepID=UPI00188D62F3|nr:FAD-dependent oxidoreductase [Psychrobacter sp. N25K4-3-2]MBF4488899.1 FAD-dependent oxidoreductase [Psychrobacter sp. N25K4-3-2]
MQDVPIVIVGGGLSGLYAAFLLEQKGIDYILIEARDRLGGRITVAKSSAGQNASSQSVDHKKSNDGFDLGPSWFWPEYQPQLSDLIEALDLPRFAQFEEGDTMVERAANELPIRTQGYQSSPPSMRLVGGMTALTDALYARLDAKRVITGQIVKRLTKTGQHIEIESEDSFRYATTLRAQHILLALPPRLAGNNIVFEPALPQDLAIEWQETATWMAPHAKYVAVYDSPFWRNQGLSGAARSAIGPLTEIHDASLVEGKGAVFGFFGVPAQVRQNVSEMALKAHCRAQMVRLFGTQANTPTAEYIKDWAQDPFTAMPADASGAGQHAVAPASKPTAGVWQDSLTGCGSEWSAQFPGYVAGAIDAANRAVQGLPNVVVQSGS